jgi:hypothetical protein
VWVQPEPETNLITNPNAAVDLTDATTTNAALFRQVSGSVNSPYFTLFRLNASANAASWLNIGGDTGAVRLGLQAGKTYTVRGSFHLDTPLTGTVDANARRIVAYTRVGAGAYVLASSSAAPNVAGDHDVSVTFTMPANPSEAFVRFFLGHTGGSGYWYRLKIVEGTASDFWDGETPDAGGISDPEYSWNGLEHRSTSRRVLRANNTLLPDASLDLTYDSTRTPFISARITMPRPSDAIVAALDPRRPYDVIFNFAIDEYARTGVNGPFTTRVDGIPFGYPVDTAGKLWHDSDDADELSDVLTITATGGEVKMDDKIRLSAATLDTGATTVAGLVEYALNDVGEWSAVGGLGASGLTAVPAGDRRLWLPAEPASQLYEAELSAIDLRLYGDDRGKYWVDEYTNPPVGLALLLPLDLEDGEDGTIISARRRRARRSGGWADGIMVKSDYENAAGTRVVAYQRFPASGQNHVGKVVNIARAIPSSTYAESIYNRAQTRGEAFTLVAHCDLGVRPGRPVNLTLVGKGTVDYMAERVTFRPDAGVVEADGYIS